MMKTKVTITIIILLAGALFTFILHDIGTNSTRYQSEGILLDFGEYNTTWTDADFNDISDPVELLEYACTQNSYTYTITDGIVTEIDGLANNLEKSWNLWYIPSGKDNYLKSDTYNIDPSKNKITTWAYCGKADEPTIALDASGTSFYGYGQPSRTVTLSPVCTEILGSVGGINTLVGTDIYSNYPNSVKERQDSGSISIVGTYTDPSYESIMHASPDMVFCDGSQYNQKQVAKTLRNSDVNAVLIFDGENVDTILDNIFIIGNAMRYNLSAKTVLNDLSNAMAILSSLMEGGASEKTMFALSPDSAPWIAGDNTYASDILYRMGAVNIYKSMDGWTHINSEYVGPTESDTYDPEVIFVILDGSYSATESDYNYVIAHLPDNWKSTKAYKEGKIYALCEKLGEMSQRYGPRFAQLSEIISRQLDPDAFGDGIVLPKYIGSNYADYLTYTKYLGYDN